MTNDTTMRVEYAVEYPRQNSRHGKETGLHRHLSRFGAEDCARITKGTAVALVPLALIDRGDAVDVDALERVLPFIVGEEWVAVHRAVGFFRALRAAVERAA